MTDSKGVSKAMDVFIERLMRRLQLRVYQAVTIANPVKTGFSRAHWRPEASTPDQTPVEGPSDAKVAERQAVVLFSRNQQISKALAAGYKLRQGEIFISNPVVYVKFLNQGTSSQAPKRWIERAIAKAVRATVADVSGGGGAVAGGRSTSSPARSTRRRDPRTGRFI